MGTYEIRPATSEEFPEYARKVVKVFGEVLHEGDLDNWRLIFEPDRSLVTVDRGRIVGTTAALSFELTVPGGATPRAAGVTNVGVQPTHRRRGVLTGMMRRQLADVRERGEPLAVLLAAEAPIYGRFGYGQATRHAEVHVDTHARFATPVDDTGEIDLLDSVEAGKVLPELYDRLRRTHHGEVSRSAGYWELLMKDPEHEREGASELFHAVHLDATGRADGYATYRIKAVWDGNVPNSTLLLRELLAETPAVARSLWSFVLAVDLVRTVQAQIVAVDDPLPWQLEDARHARIVGVRDWLWARLVDVPAALAARTYGAEGSLVVDVSDQFLPDSAGKVRLDAGPDGADARRDPGATPDLACDVSALGAAYLGDVSFFTLAAAGRVEERTAGALARADALFRTPIAPFCLSEF